jgi:uncharacterized membrane protein YidH (DUF202 family)
MELQELPIVEETRQGVLVEDEGASTSWFLKLINRYSPSYLLINKGATARDALANERTFLSYLRTSMAMLGLGITIPQISRLPSDSSSSTQAALGTTGLVAGSLFMILSMLFVVGGTIRYFYAQALMVRGLFPASRGLVVSSSVFLLAVTLGTFIAIIVIEA